MGTYLVLVEPSTGEVDYLLDVNRKMFGGLVQFNGTCQQAADFYTKKVIYGGDANGCPEDYKRISDMPYGRVYVIPFDGYCVGELADAIAQHNTWHDERDAKDLEERELVELRRLQEKYAAHIDEECDE